MLNLRFATSLTDFGFSAAFIEKIPIAFARQHCLLGLSAPDQPQLIVAFAHRRNWPQLDVLGRIFVREILPLVAPPQIILAAINDAYQQPCGQAESMIQTLDHDAVLAEVEQWTGREDLLDVASRAPVIKLVNLMLFEAVKALASDVHVQPYEQKLIVRMRIDGVLYNSFELPTSIQDEVISRVKVMGRMNIAEKRLAQDGRATVQVGDRLIDLRIATLPTSVGERIVIRLLDKSARLYQLGELGMPGTTLTGFRQLITQEHGLLLVTGPTGSGKSTTLYAALKELDCTEHNILTLEDPIEYQLEGISQTQVSDKKGMTFASGLRSVLRQDPDVIMVGEIRDRETATMAIQSALTGHLVFSTLHTNDAASAITRLLDLGIEPYLVASSVIGVLAQRLVRRICGACADGAEASEHELAWLGIEGRAVVGELRRGRGCARCRATGYSGRFGLFELLPINEPVRRLIQGRATASQVRSAAVVDGMRTLRDDGVDKVLAGLTTVNEVERVTTRDPDDSLDANEVME
jgi:general secretion pathway protein E